MIRNIEITFQQHAFDNIFVHNANFLYIKPDSTFKYFLIACLYLDFNATQMSRRSFIAFLMIHNMYVQFLKYFEKPVEKTRLILI